MKIFAATLFLLFIVIGCSKEEQNEATPIEITNIDVSGCKTENKSTTVSSESIRINTTKNKIILKHYNTLINCCQDEVVFEAKLYDNVIEINEKSKEFICNCLCPVDLECTLNKIPEGKYTILFKRQGRKISELSVSVPLDEAVLVSF